MTAVPPPTGVGDRIISAGECAVCGHHGRYERSDLPTRENFKCGRCGASLRYRHQASVLIEEYATGERNLHDLVSNSVFRSLDIYEPGVSGPFRRIFSGHPSYTTSYQWRGVPIGRKHQGVRCEDLERLTWPDERFDLLISSDIFEHVRKPQSGFEEVFRVLRAGGRHIFTVPFKWPIPSTTRVRVDTSGPVDQHLAEPMFHKSPMEPEGSLVYTEFGLDLLEQLRMIGFRTVVHHAYRSALTIVASKPPTG